MKQTTKVVILLVLLTATLFLTGCPKEPSVQIQKATREAGVKQLSLSQPLKVLPTMCISLQMQTHRLQHSILMPTI